MKLMIRRIAAALAVILATTACQESESLIPDSQSEAPVVGEATFSSDYLIYGTSINFAVTVESATELSHVDVSLEVNNAVVWSTSISANNSTTVAVDEDFSVAFGAMAIDVDAEVVVTAMNKEFKQVERRFAVELKRPDLGTLTFTPEDNQLSAVQLSLSTDSSYEYTASCEYDNDVTGFISSDKGYQWGFDQTEMLCSLSSSSAISLTDSNSSDNKVSLISFDALTFEVAPLKEEKSVNGVTFTSYKINSDDDDVVGRSIKATNVSMTQGDEVSLSLIDLSEITFDPDFFEVSDDKLYYTGQSGSVDLYLNTLYKFVFVVSQENPLSTDSVYPDVLFINGWGIGRPTIWDYHPNWSFSSAVVLRQESSQDGNITYTQTLAASQYATFKLYTGSDWGYEIYPPDMIFEDSNFKSEKEDGKDSYNIYTSDGFTNNSAVVKISLTIGSDNSYTFKSEILCESDED